jgi:hypothetical protein
MTRTLPRRAVFAALAAFFGLFLLVHGYTRPGLLVIGKKVVEVKLPPEPGLPEDVPAWIEKPPTTQKVIEDFTATVPEWEAMVQRMAKAFAAGQFETGLAQAIDEISVPLVRHFALDATAANRNELPDQPSLG